MIKHWVRNRENLGSNPIMAGFHCEYVLLTYLLTPITPTSPANSGLTDQLNRMVK